MSDSEKQFDAWFVNKDDDLLVSHSDAWDIWNEAQSVLVAQGEQHRAEYQKIIDGLKQELDAAKEDINQVTDLALKHWNFEMPYAESVVDTVRMGFEQAEAENAELRDKLAEYEGENKRWHSFETVQAIVKERDSLCVDLDDAHKLIQEKTENLDTAEQRAATLRSENEMLTNKKVEEFLFVATTQNELEAENNALRQRAATLAQENAELREYITGALDEMKHGGFDTSPDAIGMLEKALAVGVPAEGVK